MQVATLALLVLAGCPGPAPAPVTPPPPEPVDLPDTTLGGLPLPPTPRPLEESSTELREGLRLAGDALAAQVPEPPGERDFERIRSWMQLELQDWLEQKTFALEAAEEMLGQVDDAAEQVVAEAVVAILYHALATDLASVPIARDLENDPERRTRLSRNIEERVLPLVERAAEGFGRCRERGTTLPRWRSFCDDQLASIEASWGDPPAVSGEVHPVLARAAFERALGTAPPGAPPGCFAAELSRRPGRTVGPVEPPSGPRAREGTRPALGVLSAPILMGPEEAPLTGAERERLVEAVHGALRRIVRARLLPLRESSRIARAAESDDGCAIGRSAADLFRSEHPEAWLAEVLPHCTLARCTLDVRLSGPAGTAPEGGFPGRLTTGVEGATDVAIWIAAAAQLAPAPADEGAVLEAFAPLGSEHELELLAFAPHGPWGETSDEEMHPALMAFLSQTAGDRMITCLGMDRVAEEVFSYLFVVGADGAPLAVFAPAARATDHRRCVDESLRQLPFPAGAEGRRLVLSFAYGRPRWTLRDYRYGRFDRATGVRVHAVATTGDEGLRADLPLDDPRLRAAVAACHSGELGQGDVAGVRAELRVTSAGRPRGVDAQLLPGSGGGDAEGARFAECVGAALLATSWRCPAADEAVVEATVCAFRDP